MRLIDISQTLRPELAVFPGDVSFSIHSTMSIESGDAVTVSELRGSAHAGTHIDFPAHFSSAHRQYPLETFFGPAIVVDATDWDAVCSIVIEPGLRVLLKTSHTATDRAEFDENFNVMPPPVVEWLIRSRAVLVGVDVSSVDAAASHDLANHHQLLAADIAILENLDLSGAAPGAYTLAAFPVKTAAPDAAWVRAVLIAN